MTAHPRQREVTEQEKVQALRQEAERLKAWECPEMEPMEVRLRAAADLLEVHVMTGINLTTFGYVEAFVNQQIDSLDQGLPHVRDNGA